MEKQIGNDPVSPGTLMGQADTLLSPSWLSFIYFLLFSSHLGVASQNSRILARVHVMQKHSFLCISSEDSKQSLQCGQRVPQLARGWSEVKISLLIHNMLSTLTFVISPACPF